MLTGISLLPQLDVYYVDRRHRIIARDAPVGCDLLVPSGQQLLLVHGLVRGRSGSTV